MAAAGWASRGDNRVSVRDAAPGQAMSIADLLESAEAKALLDAAQQAGAVSIEEIAVALDELELEASVIGEFYTALEELDIEVVGREVEAAERDLDDVREVSTDALQLFLKDIGKVELLTAAQEVELA